MEYDKTVKLELDGVNDDMGRSYFILPSGYTVEPLGDGGFIIRGKTEMENPSTRGMEKAPSENQ